MWRCLFCILPTETAVAGHHVNSQGSGPDFGPRDLSQRLENGRAMLVGRFSRPGDHSRSISGHFGDFGPDPLSETSTSVLSQQQTSVLSQHQASILSQQQTSVLSQQKTSILSQQRTSNPGLRRPRQRPTKSMTANPWLTETAIAADQKSLHGAMYDPSLTAKQKRQRRLFCLLYTSPSPRDYAASRMPSSA